MSCSLGELHCAVHSLLVADSQLMSVATRIYNHVPQRRAVYPYATIGRIDGSAFITFDDQGDDMIYNIDIYGKSKDLGPIYEIAQRIKELLAGQENNITDAGACCIVMFKYDGMIENPQHNMEVEGRLLTVEFQVKIL